MRKGDALLGMIVAARSEVRPFTAKQIALLENFAAQAVIAIENARLITEQREALEQQTATAEVLQVINSSPGDLTPVFEAMLDKATRLCEARYGLLATYDGDRFHGAAAVGFPMAIAQGLSKLGHPPPATVLGRLERTKETVQMEDISSEPSYAEVFAVNPILRGVRTSLSVPMLKEGQLVGAFNVFRREIRPFADKQVALLENFAAQAFAEKLGARGGAGAGSANRHPRRRRGCAARRGRRRSPLNLSRPPRGAPMSAIGGILPMTFTATSASVRPTLSVKRLRRHCQLCRGNGLRIESLIA